MSVRWMAVQYLGDVLRLPIVNASDIDKPFGESVLERGVKRIIINPFSESRQTFVPESEIMELRELVSHMYRLMDESCAVQHPYAPEPIRYDTLMDVYEKLRELGIEVTP